MNSLLINLGRNVPLIQGVWTIPRENEFVSLITQMSKTKPNMTIEGHIWDRFKKETENASEAVERFMKEFVEEEDEDLDSRKEALEKELKDLRKEKERIKEEISQKETKLDALETKRAKQEEKREKLIKALDILSRKKKTLKIRKSIQDTNAFRHWMDELDMDEEELLEKMKDYNEEG